MPRHPSQNGGSEPGDTTGPWRKVCARVHARAQRNCTHRIRAVSDPFAVPAFIVALVGIIVAVVGALTGVEGLWWQIATRQKVAHNVHVSVSPALPAPDSGVMPDWQVCISPANIRVAPVAVTGWGLEMPIKRGPLIQTKA